MYDKALSKVPNTDRKRWYVGLITETCYKTYNSIFTVENFCSQVAACTWFAPNLNATLSGAGYARLNGTVIAWVITGSVKNKLLYVTIDVSFHLVVF